MKTANKLIWVLSFSTICIISCSTNNKFKTEDGFVKRSSIEWAGTIHDTVSFRQINLAHILREKLEKDDIRIQSLLGTDSLKTVTKQQLAVFYENLTGYPLFGTDGKINPLYYTDAGSNIRFDQLSHNLMYVYQVLYIENGSPGIYISKASPSISFYISGNKKIGTGEFFTTAVQSKYNKSGNSKARNIGLTSKIYKTDSIASNGNLKQLYGRNFLQSLWPSIVQNRFQVVFMKTGETIKAKNGQLFSPDTVRVPKYDYEGNLISSEIIHQMISPLDIKTLEITQSWYYDYKRNHIFSEIENLILYTADSGDFLLPVLKIIFE